MVGLFEIGVCEMLVYYDMLVLEVFYFEICVVLFEGYYFVWYVMLMLDFLDSELFIVMGLEYMMYWCIWEVFESWNVSWCLQIYIYLLENFFSFVKWGMGIVLIDLFIIYFDKELGYVICLFELVVMLDFVIIIFCNCLLMLVV